MCCLRFHLPIQLFLLLVITANVEGFLSFFTNPASPSLIKHHHDIAQPASHYPNLRLEAVHVLASMHSNCPDAHNIQQGANSDMQGEGAYINPFAAMSQQGMGIARDTKISSVVTAESHLSDGFRGTTPPPRSSKTIHSGINNEELRSVSTTIHENADQVQGKLKGTTPPPDSSNHIHSEGLSNGVLRDSTPPPGSSGSVHNEVNELGKLRGSSPSHGSSKNIHSGLYTDELRSDTPLPHSQSSKSVHASLKDGSILKGETPSPGSSGPIQ